MAHRVRAVFIVVFASVMVWHCVGCAALTQGSAVEKGITQLAEKVIVPAVTKAGEQLAGQTAQIQGQASIIEPGMEVEGHMTYGPAVVYRFTMKAVGVSANLAAAGMAAKTEE